MLWNYDRDGEEKEEEEGEDDDDDDEEEEEDDDDDEEEEEEPVPTCPLSSLFLRSWAPVVVCRNFDPPRFASILANGNDYITN